MTESNEKRYIIVKQGAYYRPNERGYTGSMIQAGRYTLEEAEKITHPNGPDGPRDGMSYFHEGNSCHPDWLLYCDLRDKLESAQIELKQTQLANRIFKRSLDLTKNKVNSTEWHLTVARQAMNQCRLAVAGYVSARSAIDELDDALARLEKFSKEAEEDQEPQAEPPVEPESLEDKLLRTLRLIAEGKGCCSVCNRFAEGASGGVLICDCKHASWVPVDPAKLAEAVLARFNEKAK